MLSPSGTLLMLGNSDCSDIMVYVESMVWFDFTVTSMEQGEALQHILLHFCVHLCDASPDV